MKKKIFSMFIYQKTIILTFEKDNTKPYKIWIKENEIETLYYESYTYQDTIKEYIKIINNQLNKLL